MQNETSSKLGETKNVAAEKTTGVKVEVTKPAAEKSGKTKAKGAAKKAAKNAVKEPMRPEIFVQFQGQEAVVEEVVKKATEEYVASGHRAASIKSLQIYLKPEEHAAYYVINQKAAGKVELF